MSDPIQSRPLSATGRENYDRIFRKKIPRPWDEPPTDPIHSLTPGTIREYRSDCCGARVLGRGVCEDCNRKCTATLTKIN